MKPSELAGWPGMHSPCSPSPSRQVIYSGKGAIGAFSFGSVAAMRRLRALDPMPCPELGKADTRQLQALDPVPCPELGKADTRSGQGTGSNACETAPERSSGGKRGRQVRDADCARRGARRMQPARGRSELPVVECRARSQWSKCRGSRLRSGARNAACAVPRAADSGPFPERVSAFPSSGKGPGSVACNQHVPAFPPD